MFTSDISPDDITVIDILPASKNKMILRSLPDVVRQAHYERKGRIRINRTKDFGVKGSSIIGLKIPFDLPL